MEKEYTVVKTKSDLSSTRKTEYTGTVERLANEVFGYTLDIGHSHDARINMHPKTIKGLISAVNKSFGIKNQSRFTLEYIELKTN